MKEIFKKIKPWGFSGLSIYDVTIFFWKGLINGSITTRASSLAFNFFLAFFPSLIVFLTLIPYIPIEGIQENLMELLAIVLPETTYEITFTTLEDIINNLTIDLYNDMVEDNNENLQIMWDNNYEMPEDWMYIKYPFLFN